MLSQATDVHVGLNRNDKLVGDIQHCDAVENSLFGANSCIESFGC